MHFRRSETPRETGPTKCQAFYGRQVDIHDRHKENTLLCYGTEAVIPAKVEVESLHIHQFDHEQNDVGLRLNLDALDEVREGTLL